MHEVKCKTCGLNSIVCDCLMVSAPPSYKEIVAAWNSQADDYNQWHELGEDEKVEFAARLSFLPGGAITAS